MSHLDQSHGKQSVNALTVAALGIVFGDIGTSPLYAVREAFHGPDSISLSAHNILGILSLIIWSLILVISVKYLMFVMRADNKGEGGVMALTSLAAPKEIRKASRLSRIILYMGLFGSALLFGDGVITPAISVLSAVEGLKVATPLFEPYVIPITVAILFALFYGQKFGTEKIGRVFGPVILIWFLVLGALGLHAAFQNPKVFVALNPIYGFNFFLANGWAGVFSLGAVFLVCTGGEALYADMGHLGRAPIQRAWFFVAFPGLILNYFGQAAVLIADPSAVENPFFNLVPKWGLYPLVVLSTLATVIASQALITGVFSLTRQGIQLGYMPRLKIVHTSSHEIGQIYIPQINWLLFVLTVWLVNSFGSSSALASAYGIAVAATMVITTILTCTVAVQLWRWSLVVVALIAGIFLSVDGVFLAANSTKISDGGWFPLLLGFFVFTLMTTWRTGRTLLRLRLRRKSLPLERFLENFKAMQLTPVPGTAIFMTGDPKVAPLALLHNIRHNKCLHSKNIILTMFSVEVPQVADSERIQIEELSNGFYRVIARYGFIESPDVPRLMELCRSQNFAIDASDATFFLGKETLIVSEKPGMAMWRETLFAFMSRNAAPATAYFNIPAPQVIEVGLQVEI